jgi:hypothetical protein
MNMEKENIYFEFQNKSLISLADIIYISHLKVDRSRENHIYMVTIFLRFNPENIKILFLNNGLPLSKEESIKEYTDFTNKWKEVIKQIRL